jgi:hypothetical protein
MDLGISRSFWRKPEIAEFFEKKPLSWSENCWRSGAAIEGEQAEGLSRREEVNIPQDPERVTSKALEGRERGIPLFCQRTNGNTKTEIRRPPERL